MKLFLFLKKLVTAFMFSHSPCFVISLLSIIAVVLYNTFLCNGFPPFHRQLRFKSVNSILKGQLFFSAKRVEIHTFFHKNNFCRLDPRLFLFSTKNSAQQVDLFCFSYGSNWNWKHDSYVNCEWGNQRGTLWKIHAFLNLRTCESGHNFTK